MSGNDPRGFILSDAAMYSFECQDIYPDLVSFAAAIPEHLRSLFLIPVVVDPLPVVDLISGIASRVASRVGCPSGHTDDADLFSVKTFVTYDTEPGVPSGEEESIFEIWDPRNRSKHQERNWDQNVQSPTDTSYMSDVDPSLMMVNEGYPYRSELEPGLVRHSSVLLTRLALKPDVLQQHAPQKVRDRALTCNVDLTSYDKPSRVFTFAVNCGNVPHVVKASLSEIDEVAMSCDCGFWRWNGPEFHAKQKDYMLGSPRGTAGPPDIRDPDRKYWLCKHTYAVLRRLESFVEEIVEENWALDDNELLNVIDSEWDRVAGAVDIPLEEVEAEDPTLKVVGMEEPSEEGVEVEEEELPPVEETEEEEELPLVEETELPEGEPERR